MSRKRALAPALPNHKNTMPKLIPVPIETKGKGFFKALWIWYFTTRRWEFESDWDFYCPGADHTFVIPKGFIFDGASIPRRFRAYLSPVGLLLVPGIIHDFGYRYEYIWVRKKDGGVRKAYNKARRDEWDKLFYTVGNYVNGVFIINFLAWLALAFAGWFAWYQNRKNKPPKLKPKPITLKTRAKKSKK